MSIEEFDKIDGMGISKNDKNTLILLLTDHLIWDDEEAHLYVLQEKINAYAGYIESKQYERIYPNNQFDHFIIKICFLHQYPESCTEFLSFAEQQLAPLNITFYASVENM